MPCQELQKCTMYFLGTAPWQRQGTEFPWQMREPEVTEQPPREQPPPLPIPEIMPSDPLPKAFMLDGGVRPRIKVSKKAMRQAMGQDELELTKEPKRTWPKDVGRICASSYTAVEIHGFFGLIDDGSSESGRMLKVHVPRWIRGYFLDIKQGDTVHVYHVNGKIGGMLKILSVGRDKYYPPGRRVTTCTICVSEDEWARFAQFD